MWFETILVFELVSLDFAIRAPDSNSYRGNCYCRPKRQVYLSTTDYMHSFINLGCIKWQRSVNPSLIRSISPDHPPDSAPSLHAHPHVISNASTAFITEYDVLPATRYVSGPYQQKCQQQDRGRLQGRVVLVS